MRSLLPLLACLALLMLSQTGCEKSSVEGVVRESKFEPQFGASTESVPVANNSVALDFLTPDQFAGISFRVDEIRQHPDLSDVPWANLESQLARLIGNRNADLTRIERAWLLVDRSVADILQSRGKQPLSIVLEYSTPIDRADLQAAQQQVEAQLEATNVEPAPGEPQPDPLFARDLSDHRIAISSVSNLENMKSAMASAASPGELARTLRTIDLQSHVEGAVTMGPIREFLQMANSMMRSFGGESQTGLESLPAALQPSTFQFSLSEPTTFQLDLMIDDAKLTKQLAEMANRTEGGGGLPAGGMASMLTGFGGGDLASLGQSPSRTAMITPSMTKVAEAVGQEISTRDLFSIKPANDRLLVKLDRPRGLTDLIQAAIADSTQQLVLADRVSKMEQVALAMKQYEEQHGCLPPIGPITEHPDGLPDQLNWRVGLLPLLGYEELYQQFHHAEPWNSEHNLQVAANMPPVFGRKPDVGTTIPTTCLTLVGGEASVYRDSAPPKLSEISDAVGWTALATELAEDWAQPWTATDFVHVNSENADELGRTDENGVLFITAKFETVAIQRNTGTLQALLTSDQGERTSRNERIRLGLD